MPETALQPLLTAIIHHLTPVGEQLGLPPVQVLAAIAGAAFLAVAAYIIYAVSGMRSIDGDGSEPAQSDALT